MVIKKLVLVALLTRYAAAVLGTSGGCQCNPCTPSNEAAAKIKENEKKWLPLVWSLTFYYIIHLSMLQLWAVPSHI